MDVKESNVWFKEKSVVDEDCYNVEMLFVEKET